MRHKPPASTPLLSTANQPPTTHPLLPDGDRLARALHALAAPELAEWMLAGGAIEPSNRVNPDHTAARTHVQINPADVTVWQAAGPGVWTLAARHPYHLPLAGS